MSKGASINHVDSEGGRGFLKNHDSILHKGEGMLKAGPHEQKILKHTTALNAALLCEFDQMLVDQYLRFFKNIVVLKLKPVSNESPGNSTYYLA